MNNVIQGNFPKQWTLAQAKEFLEDYYDHAMNWSIEELRSTTYDPQAYFTDAHEAYLAILRFRQGLTTPPSPVVNLADYRTSKMKKAA